MLPRPEYFPPTISKPQNGIIVIIHCSVGDEENEKYFDLTYDKTYFNYRKSYRLYKNGQALADCPSYEACQAAERLFNLKWYNRAQDLILQFSGFGNIELANICGNFIAQCEKSENDTISLNKLINSFVDTLNDFSLEEKGFAIRKYLGVDFLVKFCLDEHKLFNSTILTPVLEMFNSY
jgi:hypothetical protein